MFEEAFINGFDWACVLGHNMVILCWTKKEGGKKKERLGLDI